MCHEGRPTRNALLSTQREIGVPALTHPRGTSRMYPHTPGRILEDMLRTPLSPCLPLHPLPTPPPQGTLTREGRASTPGLTD